MNGGSYTFIIQSCQFSKLWKECSTLLRFTHSMFFKLVGGWLTRLHCSPRNIEPTVRWLNKEFDIGVSFSTRVFLIHEHIILSWRLLHSEKLSPFEYGYPSNQSLWDPTSVRLSRHLPPRQRGNHQQLILMVGYKVPFDVEFNHGWGGSGTSFP